MSILGDVFGKPEKKTPEAPGRAKEIQQKVDQLESRFGELEKKTDGQIQKVAKNSAHHLKEMESSIQPMGKEIDKLKETVEPMGEEIDKLKETIEPIGEEIDRLRESVQPSGEELEKLREAVQGLEEKMNELRVDMVERIHEENVKCYRNLKSLLTEFEGSMQDQLENIGQPEELKKTVKKWKLISVYVIIDFILLVVYIAFSAGALDRIISTFL